MAISGVSSSTALSGLRAISTSHSATADNVANVNTPGYAVTERIFENKNPGVEVHLSKEAKEITPAESVEASAFGGNNVSLVQEAVHQIKGVAGYKANAAVIKADDEMPEALLDIKV